MTSAAIAWSLLSASAARAQSDDVSATAPGERATPARDAPSASGTVISIDQEDIVLDLGSSKGGVNGSVVDLWRPFKLRHPVTGQTLTDRFRIGALRLVQVQKTLALARPEGVLARVPAAGDVVVMTHSTERPPVTHPSAVAGTRTAPNAPSGEPLDAEGRELCAMFDSLQGEPIATRILRYEQFLQAHPNGTYARVLWEEADALRKLLGEKRAATNRLVDGPERGVTFTPPSSALAHEPLAIGVEIPRAAGAVLHVRHAGEMAYQSFPMRAAGARYYRGTIDAAQMQGPEVEYFIESVAAVGTAVPAVGTADAPQKIEVHEAPRPLPPSRPAASAAIFTDYADYNRLRGNDYAWQTEGQFGLRYADKGVRAVRSGFGVYRGFGGSVLELDSLGRRARRVGLTYGYLEGEFATSRIVALIGRLALGLTDDGVNGGGQFFVRLGNDQMTNLLLGGEVLGGIGTRGIAELQWNTLPRVPIVLRTEVTNQPAGTSPGRSTAPDPASTVAVDRGDIGARAMVQVGYRLVPELTVALRASYEGRTIQHAGPGAGAGATFSW
ncbi:MAG TPA: hypothetical protein VK540_20450 [Polyangiaceae bacterium]|nr:hypothetical protein [Polyangiaceae bacterium]